MSNVRRTNAAAGVLLLAAATACTGAPGPSQAADADALVTTVERIVDGDTLYLEGLQERLRLIGIDAPETRLPDRGSACMGPQAAAYLAELVPPRTTVRVQWDVERTDRFDRPLGYLYRAGDGLFVNLELVSEGYATSLPVPPNVAHEQQLTAAARGARDAGRGLWSACEQAPG